MGKNVEHLNESVKIVLQFSAKTYFNVAIFHLFKNFQSNTNVCTSNVKMWYFQQNAFNQFDIM